MSYDLIRTGMIEKKGNVEKIIKDGMDNSTIPK